MLAKYAPRNLKKRFKQEKKKKNLLQSQMKEVTAKPNILQKESAQLSQSLYQDYENNFETHEIYVLFENTEQKSI